MQEERNRNALRSQRLIREAYIALCEERGEQRITVADICRRADINRTTFYAHYDGLDDLEQRLTQGMIDGFGTWLAAEPIDQFLEDPLPGLMRLANYIEEIAPLLRAQSKRHLRMGESFGMRVRTALLNATGPREGKHLLRFDFIAAALTNVYFTWFVGSYGSMTINELNQTLVGYIRGCASVS